MGYIDSYCKSPETREKNALLNRLYRTWYQQSVGCFDTNSITDEREKKLPPLHLLTCTDAFFSGEKRVMIFGQESHDKDNTKNIYNFPPCKYHLKDYSFCESIHAGKAKKTLFLKQRFILAGLDRNLCKKPLSKEDIRKFESVLLNNLNKTSYNGSHTPVMHSGILDIIYRPFVFREISGEEEYTVFEHELNLVRPDKIIFMCGRSYCAHIERNFKRLWGTDSLGIIKEKINSLNLADRPVSGPVTVCWGKNKEHQAEVLLCYHPNAHMTDSAREQYNQALSLPG